MSSQKNWTRIVGGVLINISQSVFHKWCLFFGKYFLKTSCFWLLLICCCWLIWPLENDAKILKNTGTWILICEYLLRAIQWIPIWQGLDGFYESLRPCALDKITLSIGRVNDHFRWRKGCILVTKCVGMSWQFTEWHLFKMWGVCVMNEGVVQADLPHTQVEFVWPNYSIQPCLTHSCLEVYLTSVVWICHTFENNFWMEQ